MLFTSESVTKGHPDKVCDQISDAILDNLLEKDPESHVAVECAVKSGLVFIFGEISTEAWCNTEKVARDVIRKIGYNSSELGFDYRTCGVISSISEQSREIAKGVGKKEQGAGDQGMMFGYASNETPEYMPLPITLANKMARKLAKVREQDILSFLRPDGKTQVTVEYDNGDINGSAKPKRVDTVVVSAQHDPKIKQEELKKSLWKELVLPSLGDWVDEKTKFLCNPAGSFALGGPVADSGLTGRKIIVDTYGGVCAHGGGCFSGKDASKVDRSGAYVARYIAKNLVAGGLAEKCQVQIAYAIGVAKPVSVYVNSFGTSKFSNLELQKIVQEYFPLKPAEIIKKLDLKKPIFKKTAVGGHFGRKSFSWEQLDLAPVLQKKYL